LSYIPSIRVVVQAIYRGDETVAASRQRFDEPRALGGVPQGIPQLVDRGVQAVVEVDEGIGRPVLIAKFFAGYHFTWPLRQDR